MKLVNFISNIPEEQLAMDELLLQKAEAGEIGETLRFWTSPDPFVVVGRAGRVKEDCFLGKCLADNVKIIRRISGGGTVLQGPGCVNYSVILSYGRKTAYRNINTSYKSILGDISGALGQNGLKTEYFPASDLAVNGKKISGNAQARKRRYFLHHGTFLCDFDLGKIPRYLRHPAREPEYRQGRSHEDFLANARLPGKEIKKALKDAFSGPDRSWEPQDKDLKILRDLAQGKYKSKDWNYAF